MAILLFFMTVSLLGTFFLVQSMSQKIMTSEKEGKLLLAANLLDFQLGERDYEDILIKNGVGNATREEKIAALNRELSAIGDSMTAIYPDMGVGYYSLELDAILTYAPSAQYKDTIGKPIAEDHPGRIVMATNQALVRTGSMVRGNIMNAMHPIPKAGGDLGEVIESINAMAADILRAEEDHKALLLAEASNLAQRDFLSRMSHEIRTPMNGVLGMTQLAQSAQTEEQRMAYLGKIHASASLLLRIINDILDVSRIEAGKMEIEAHPFKLTEIIENICDLMAPRVDEKGLSLTVLVEKSVPEMLVGDSLRISQILFNIIGNAVKFTMEGSIKLRVYTLAMPEDMLHLHFSVTDTGIGMDSQQQAEVFKSFTQADSSTARKFGGSGLGLSISKALIELMGGEIGVKSQKDVGSEFFFYVLTAGYEGDEQQDADEDLSPMLNQRYENYTLLLVEDVEINQEIAKAILENMGFAVDIASNGREGIDAFVAKGYDLIFMDIRMPVMDGIEATREIRRIERERAEAGAAFSRIPIIAMTANAMQEDRDATKDAGMDAHIAKPIDMDEISLVLYKTLIK